MSCGSAPVRPKLSGSHAVLHRMPNRLSKYLNNEGWFVLGQVSTCVGTYEPLPEGELPDQSLAAGHVRVVLDPRAADGVERARLNLLLDTLEERGVQLMGSISICK